MSRAQEQKTYGAYRLLERIGEGGMARVYRAEHMADRSVVALKVFAPEDLSSQEFLKRVKREIATLKQCSHPNIVKVHGYSLTGQGCFLALHYIEGPNLDEHVAEHGRFSVDEVCRIARDMAGALAYCHARGLIHRDIKPANIMIEKNSGKSILLDFGIVKATNMTDISVMNQVRGTLTYMSPEQFLNRPVDGRTDIYMLGLVLVKAAKGEDPFDMNKALSLEDLTGNRPLPSVIEKVPDFPAGLETVIHNCLHADPKARYPTAHDLIADLDRYAAGQTVKLRVKRKPTLKMKVQETRGPVVSTQRMGRVNTKPGGAASSRSKWTWILGLSPLIILSVVVAALLARRFL